MRNLMKAISHGSPVPQFAIDKKHRVIFWNEALEKYSGIKSKDIIGTDEHWRAFYPSKRPCMADLVVDGNESRIPGYYPGKNKRSSFVEGTYDVTDFFPALGESGVWLYLTVVPIKDDKNRIIGAIETLEDITILKQTEKTLRENEAYIRTILDNLPIGVAVNSVEPEVLFEYFNENFLKYYRVTPQALKRPDGFWEEAYEDPVFREEIKRRVLEDSKGKDPKKMHWEDLPITRAGGETTYISARNIPVPGRNIVISTVWDVTERKRAEIELKKSRMKLSEAMDLANLVNWEMDAKTGIFTFDDRFYALYGTDQRREGGIHMSFEDYAERFVHPDDRHLVAGELKKATDTADPDYVSQVDHRIISRDGETRYIAVRLGVINDEKGRTVKVHGANQDITIRKKTQEALFIANKKLNMLSSITRHDILNLIMVVKGYIELSEKTDDEALLKDYSIKEKQAIDAIQHQIGFTRYYQDIGMKEPKWHNAKELADSAFKSLQTENIRFENSLEGVEIFADPLIEKVFYNLIENTTRHGGDVSRISLSYSETEEGLLIIYTDDGAGIPEKDKHTLFKKGYGKNTGLGLFLSREILSITGTSIDECGKEGEGVRFEITLPKGNFRVLM